MTGVATYVSTLNSTRSVEVAKNESANDGKDEEHTFRLVLGVGCLVTDDPEKKVKKRTTDFINEFPVAMFLVVITSQVLRNEKGKVQSPTKQQERQASSAGIRTERVLLPMTKVCVANSVSVNKAPFQNIIFTTFDQFYVVISPLVVVAFCYCRSLFFAILPDAA